MSLKGNASANCLLKGTINRLGTILVDAYAVAVRNGFEGTEEEWLASLKGEKGDPGDSGVFVATYGETTFAEMYEVFAAGKAVFCQNGAVMLPMVRYYAGSNKACFEGVHNGQVITYTVQNEAWTETADGLEDDSRFVAEYGTTTYQEIYDAIQEDKSVYCKNGALEFPMVSYNNKNSTAMFGGIVNGGNLIYKVNIATWTTTTEALGTVKTVNGIAPDARGNVQIGTGGGIGGAIVVDSAVHVGAEEPESGVLVWIDSTEDGGSLELDADKWVPGYWVSASGGLQGDGTNSGGTGEMICLSYIPVEAGKTYTFYSNDPDWTSTWIGVNLYETDYGVGGFVKRVTGSGATFTVIIPDNVAYLIFSSRNLVENDAYLNIRIVEGTEIPDSEPGDDNTGSGEGEGTGGSGDNGGEDSGGTGGDEPGGDDSGGTETESGWKPGYFTSNGTVSVTEDSTSKGLMYYEEYIPVTAGEKVYVYNTDNSYVKSGETFIATYDGEKNLINRLGNNSTNNVKNFAVKWLMVVVPDGVSFIRICLANMTDYHDTAVVTKEVPSMELPFADATWIAGYFGAGGSVSAQGANHEMYSTLISVEPGATYRFGNSNAEWTTDWNRANGYSDMATFKQNLQATSGSTLEYTIPDGVYYLAISCRNMSDYYTTATFEKVS